MGRKETIMKKTLAGRMAAFMLAGVMTLGMTGTVFADSPEAGSLTTPESVTLKKAIKVINHDNYRYEPSISYTYTLSGTNGGGTVSDGTTTVTFKAGSTAYLKSGSEAALTADFSSSNPVQSEDGITSRDLIWTFDPANFPSAGVYRYEVSETATSVDPAAIGIVRSEEYDKSKYLDVYVKNAASGREIYGYTLVDDEKDQVAKGSAKSQGWNAAEELDTYETYNLTVTKKIAGTGADMTAKFPFTIDLAGEMSSANIAASTVRAESASENSAVGITEGSEGDSAQVVEAIGNNESVVIKGLPKTVKYSISEANSTPDAYKANVTNVTGTTAVAVTNNNNANLAAGNGVFQVAKGAAVEGSTAAIAIEVTNSLEIISPTGVVMRFAPYLFILGASIFLIMFTRRRREDEEEEQM
jgi:hypothetical protein